jgi:hypothetical protein
MVEWSLLKLHSLQCICQGGMLASLRILQVYITYQTS